jgi:hypothetical protein
MLVWTGRIPHYCGLLLDFGYTKYMQLRPGTFSPSDIYCVRLPDTRRYHYSLAFPPCQARLPSTPSPTSLFIKVTGWEASLGFMPLSLSQHQT